MLLLVSSAYIRDHSSTFKTARFTTKLPLFHLRDATISECSSRTGYPGVCLRTEAGGAQRRAFCRADTYFPRAKRLRPVPRESRPRAPLTATMAGRKPSHTSAPSPHRCACAAPARRGRSDPGACAHPAPLLPRRAPFVPPRGWVPFPSPPDPLPVLRRCRAARGRRGEIPRSGRPLVSRGWGRGSALPGTGWLAVPDRAVAEGPAGREPRPAPLPSSLVASSRARSGEAGAVRRGAVSALRGSARAGTWLDSSGGPCRGRIPA